MRVSARTRECPARLELRDRLGRALPVLGISTSGPTPASQVTLLSYAMLNAGKASLAFSNPPLYSTRTGANALNDIKAGSNSGCDTDGFPAVQGWDAVRRLSCVGRADGFFVLTGAAWQVTGLGMPDFQKLLVVVNGGSGSD